MKTTLDIFRDPFEATGNEPFRAMRRLEREMNRLFDDFYTPSLRGSQAVREFGTRPVFNFDETEDHLLMSVDLPGVAKDDLNVEIQGNQLHITGERKKESKEEGKGRHFERSEYGKYEQTFTLPSNVDAEKLEANYQDGVLRIAIPKMEAQKGQKIKIGEAKTGWWDKLMEKKESKKLEGEKKVA